MQNGAVSSEPEVQVLPQQLSHCISDADRMPQPLVLPPEVFPFCRSFLLKLPRCADLPDLPHKGMGKICRPHRYRMYFSVLLQWQVPALSTTSEPWSEVAHSLWICGSYMAHFYKNPSPNHRHGSGFSGCGKAYSRTDGKVPESLLCPPCRSVHRMYFHWS